MKNKKGFTMVELLVTIVIMGVITGMSWPLVRRLQEQNAKSKYSTYGDALISSAKIYIDSYEEDLFYYDDDLKYLNSTTKDALKASGELIDDETQCAMISVTDLINHSLIKDINMDEMSCVSNYSFVIVKKKKNNYTYNFYLGCGKRKNGALNNSEVSLTIPEGLSIGADGVTPTLKDYCR